MSREATDRILELVEEGVLDRDTVILACLKYMSEDDVREMAQMNEFFMDDDYSKDCDESMDGDFDSAMASAGLGTDEDYGYVAENDYYD